MTGSEAVLFRSNTCMLHVRSDTRDASLTLIDDQNHSWYAYHLAYRARAAANIALYYDCTLPLCRNVDMTYNSLPGSPILMAIA